MLLGCSSITTAKKYGQLALPKLTTAVLFSLVWKFLPKFLFNQGLYRLTEKKALVLLSIIIMLAWAWHSDSLKSGSLPQSKQLIETQLQSNEKKIEHPQSIDSPA